MRTVSILLCAVGLIDGLPTWRRQQGFLLPQDVSISLSGRGTRMGAARKETEERATKDKVMAWEDKLEQLISLDTSLSQKQILVQDLLKEAPEIQKEGLDLLQGARPTSEELDDLRRQLGDDILPSLQKEIPKAAERILEAVKEKRERLRGGRNGKGKGKGGVMCGGSGAKGIMAVDPLRLVTNPPVASLIRETRNALSRTPEGLETPDYRVLVYGSYGVQIREYSPFVVASVEMKGEGSEFEKQGSAFNRLAAYLFGKNTPMESSVGASRVLVEEGGVKMEMTTPVITAMPTNSSKASSSGSSSSSSSGSRSFLQFVLPGEFDVDSAPEPKDLDILVQQVPARILAVKEFSGFATPAEVRRQLQLLKEQLPLTRRENTWRQEGPEDAYLLFQYNSPLTLPWRRKNEVAVRVGPLTGGAIQEEQGGEETETAVSTGSEETLSLPLADGAAAEVVAQMGAQEGSEEVPLVNEEKEAASSVDMPLGEGTEQKSEEKQQKTATEVDSEE
uniref:Uncharacterized protein n=1 Tax=Chromera velia CCMP2878 TaxID=1169474 RepID=A0A0G4F6Z0_9ALVE|mmetsp:Transcript_49541/g.97545  ORF Transcript_49541/g.97545 Transcript_49541/m.97545 type:complete len:506 (-) Transcript_49541:579-2096(-)|eukprot:Cvel_15517.t1-p1 / transcript=Cvel_15517.t1 / gene=Cvel_15517 / organism=Chromera_velia_CCMP2878 / gene_product=Heme-binding-like protein At3g10130, chloroplastic, putative / transcript_product=Heme-binding-like protein At3g10130, chloroplastic, putative / location=Cvel_scaffold1152:36400-40303(-) / protein_length=505 / sequence_SO=supercontig / SO=protein_coding / is_pseudo=false